MIANDQDKSSDSTTMTGGNIQKFSQKFFANIDEDNLKAELLEEKIQNFDLCYKLIVVGNSGVGKSCLALKATKDIFNENLDSTIGFEFFCFNIKIRDSIIKLQIWDTCGQEVYRSLIKNFYRNSSIAILVYSVTDRRSFNDLGIWIKQIKMNGTVDCKIVLIGNKADDAEKRVVSFEEGERFAKENSCEIFMETSAKTGLHTKELFVNCAFRLYKDYINYISNNDNDLVDEYHMVEKLKQKLEIKKLKKNGKFRNVRDGNIDDYNGEGCC